MDRQRLYRRAQTLARELRLSYPLDIEELAARLGHARGRPILLAPLPVLARFGRWAFVWDDPVEDVTVIGYEHALSPAHQALILLHELAHLILGHPGEDIDHSYAQQDLNSVGQSARQLSAELDVRLGDRPPPQAGRDAARRWRRGRQRDTDGSRKPSGAVQVGVGPYADPLEWEAEVLASILLRWTRFYTDPSGNERSRSRAASLLGENTPW